MEYKQCKRCVMDTTAKNITFDKDGLCNFCTDYLDRHHERTVVKQGKITELIESVKKSGKGKQYDCIVGVSGGVDSSYALHLAVQLGLRPLAVHMDNGWNSELATNNIHNLVKGLGVDLYTHVIEWHEYKDLMNSFFKANVIDIELLYDNAMLAVNYQQTKKYGLKYMLFGFNSSTEGIKMPEGWNWFKLDKKNIYNIQKKFGKVKIKTLPTIGAFEYKYLQKIKKFQHVPFLDYFDYNKKEALDLLMTKYNYKPYPYKHYESIFTRFYQGYILPKKFGVDKRKPHLSALVASIQMSKEEANKILLNPPYNENQLEEDIEYFLKKMEWTKERLDEYLKEPEILHSVYGTEKDSFYKWSKKYVQLKKVLSGKK